MDKVLEITSNDHIIMIDKLCKRILGHPEILGRIIKGFIKEAEDVSLEEIIELIKGKKDQEGNSYFQQLNNVIDIAHHGSVEFDYFCCINLPQDDGTMKRIYLDVEIQNVENPGYALLTRGNDYLSRMITSQNGKEYDYRNYDGMKKTYVIWILPQAAKKRIVSPLTAAGNPFLNRPKTSAAASQETVIAIGASTGGTEAILEVVKNFPENTPGVVITQHMPAGFTAMYAERLNRICKMEVREAKNGDRIRKGLMLLAPGGLQMRVVPLGNSYAVSVQEGERVNGHRPSVDVLFDSVALHVREHAIGVLLTGMGADGAAGLLRMRKNGAYTIGQDKNSCVVYGMPMEAHKIGAVCQQCPLSTIGQTVLARVSLR